MHRLNLHFRAHSLLLVYLLVAAIVVICYFTRALLVPVPFATSFSIPLGFILPLVAALGLGYSTYNESSLAVALSVRPVALIGTLHNLVLITLPILLWTLGPKGGSGETIQIARNYALFTGLVLISTILGSSWFWLPVVLWLLLCFAAGLDSFGQAKNWALPLQVTWSPGAYVMSACLLGAALSLNAHQRRLRPSRG